MSGVSLPLHATVACEAVVQRLRWSHRTSGSPCMAIATSVPAGLMFSSFGDEALAPSD